MKKIMDKLLSKLKLNKKIFIFLLIIFFIALITGALLVVFLDKNDKTITQNYLNSFIKDINNNKIEYMNVLKNSLIINILSILGIWLLGISIIGIPIILFIFFSQTFTLGFSLAIMVLNYKFSGFLLSFIYLIPNMLILFPMLFILMSYAMLLSIKLITTIIKKQQLDFKIILNKYTVILAFSAIVAIIYSLIEAFLLPSIIKLIIPILK